MGYKNLDCTFAPAFQDTNAIAFWGVNCDAIGENSRTTWKRQKKCSNIDLLGQNYIIIDTLIEYQHTARQICDIIKGNESHVKDSILRFLYQFLAT